MSSHLRRAARVAGVTVVLAATLAGTAVAQDPTDAAWSPEPVEPCGILSADEVSDVFGEAFQLMSGDPTDCGFDGDFPAGRFISLFTDLDSGTVAEIRDLWCPADRAPSDTPCAIDLQAAGRDAVYLPNAMGTLLYLGLDDGGLFSLQLVGDPIDGVDKQAALVALAELTIPRLGGGSEAPDPSVGPAASPASDASLEALFPTEIGGVMVEVQTRVGSDGELDPDDPTAQAFMEVLQAQAKTIDDLSVGIGGTTDGSVGIFAIRIAGSDIAAFGPDLLDAFVGGQEVTQERVQVAGKDVIAATVSGQTTHVYTNADVMWLVYATEPALTEVFQKLP